MSHVSQCQEAASGRLSNVGKYTHTHTWNDQVGQRWSEGWRQGWGPWRTYKHTDTLNHRGLVLIQEFSAAGLDRKPMLAEKISMSCGAELAYSPDNSILPSHSLIILLFLHPLHLQHQHYINVFMELFYLSFMRTHHELRLYWSVINNRSLLGHWSRSSTFTVERHKHRVRTHCDHIPL